MSTGDDVRPKLFRPVVQKHGATKTGYIAVMTDKPNPADDWKDESLRWVTAADYDKLREEVKDLRKRILTANKRKDRWKKRAQQAESELEEVNSYMQCMP